MTLALNSYPVTPDICHIVFHIIIHQVDNFFNRIFGAAVPATKKDASSSLFKIRFSAAYFAFRIVHDNELFLTFCDFVRF